MAVQVGADGFDLLEAIHADHAPAWLREVPAVVVLRRVWITQYHRTITEGRQEVALREDKDLSPSRQRICSPYDTDARYATKRGSGWEGYKVHLSETCDEATATGLPHLITNVAIPRYAPSLVTVSASGGVPAQASSWASTAASSASRAANPPR